MFIKIISILEKQIVTCIDLIKDRYMRYKNISNEEKIQYK